MPGGGSGGATGGGRDGSAAGAPGGGSTGTGGMMMGGTGGMPAGGTGGTMPPSPDGASVLQRNKHLSRDGHFIEPTLTKAAAMKMALDVNFKATFSGNMWANPLFFEKGPGGKGVFIAVTTSNNVYALDETTGATVWMATLGAAGVNGSTCGNINPLGILATPVIDGASGTLYVSAAIAGAGGTQALEVHALDIMTGKSRAGWPVNVSKVGNFDPKPQNPRSALSLVNGILYVAYGGHAYDCGNYHGRVAAIDINDPTKAAVWSTAGAGEAIWAPGGMPSDGDGVFASTGNRVGAGGAHQDSEQVTHITGMAVLNRTADNVFFPTSWATMDSGDADLGSSSPIIIDVPGATPSKMVVAPAKTGHLYYLDIKKLGGMGGQLVDQNLATSGNAGFTAPASYSTSKGVYIAATIGSAMCPGGAGGTNVVGVLVSPGNPVKPTVAWCAATGGSGSNVKSPIATTTDGKSEALVWFVNGAKLEAVDGDTGAIVFNGTASLCNNVRQWTSPIAVKGRIVVGADGHLCSWSSQ